MKEYIVTCCTWTVYGRYEGRLIVCANSEQEAADRLQVDYGGEGFADLWQSPIDILDITPVG